MISEPINPLWSQAQHKVWQVFWLSLKLNESTIISPETLDKLPILVYLIYIELKKEVNAMAIKGTGVWKQRQRGPGTLAKSRVWMERGAYKAIRGKRGETEKYHTLAEARARAKWWSAGGWATKITRVPKSDVMNYKDRGYRYFLEIK